MRLIVRSRRCRRTLVCGFLLAVAATPRTAFAERLRDAFASVRHAVLARAALAQEPGTAANRATTQAGDGRVTGVVTGRVTDATGRPLVATVTLRLAGSDSARTLQSDQDGAYTIPALPPGDYSIVVELPGFRTVRQARVRVAASEQVRVDVRLEVEGVAEAISVRGDTPVRLGGVGSVVHAVAHDTAVTLPLNGRSFVSLVALGAGVALPPGSSLPRINGGRPRTNEYLFDGLSVLQPEPGQVAFFPVIDAVQEFTIVSNSPPAEFGRFGGGVVSLTTRSGTNAVHGTLFEFLRHESLNARNAFAPGGQKPAFRRHQFGGVLGGPLARDRTFFFIDVQAQRQAIGRTVISTVPTWLQREGIFTEPIGGRVPLVYDPNSATTAGGAARTPFPGNSIPDERVDPVARLLLGRYPAPTLPGTANNFARTATEISDQLQADVRLDHHVAGNHRLVGNGDRVFARLSHASDVFRPVSALPDGSGATSGTLGVQHTNAWSLASGFQQALGGSLLHESRGGHTRRAVRRTAVSLATGPAADLGLPGIPATARFADTLPTFAIAGYQQLGSPPNAASDFSTSVTQLTDTLTWVKGRHVVKFGADLRWQRLNVVQPSSPTGLFQFSSLFTDQPGVPNTGAPLASFLLGQVQNFSIDLQRDRVQQRAHGHEYFVQDRWNVSGSLTIDTGVRYTLNFPSVEATDQAAVFNLDTRQLDYLGKGGRSRSARALQTLNLGPRLGLAQRLGARTLVRAGYGMVWLEQPGISTPFTTPVFPFLQNASQRSVDNLTPAFVLAHGPSVGPVDLTPDAGLGQGVFAVDHNLGSGYVQQWNVSIRRELTPALSLDVAYVGSASTRIGIPDSNLNQLSVQQLAQGAALLARVPNPYFGVIPPTSSLGDSTISVAQLLKPFPQHTSVSLYRNNVGRARYHGFEARLEQRPWHGLAAAVSYTRSRLVDDGSSVFDASILSGPIANTPIADAYNRALEQDVSAGDIPHVMVASFVWSIPSGVRGTRAASRVFRALTRGWTVSGVLTWQSGLPLPVTQATNFNAFAGFGIQRPNLMGDPELPKAERSADRWFNTDAFTVAPAFTLGTSGRNPVRGPGYANADVAFLRDLGLRGSRALQLRVEVFNLTNTVHLGPPNTTAGTPGFGSITTAFDPRVVQVAAKLQF
jgi:hypothetical protein